MKNILLLLIVLLCLVVFFIPIVHDGVVYPSVSTCLEFTVETPSESPFEVAIYKHPEFELIPGEGNCYCFTTGQLRGGKTTLWLTGIKIGELHPYDSRLIRLKWKEFGTVAISINELKLLPVKQDSLYGAVAQIDERAFLSFLKKK